MTKQFVIYSERDGVYLGSSLGLGFWSKLDPVGQDCAVTFKSTMEAIRFMATWDASVELDGVRVVAVEADYVAHGIAYASIARCVEAGLPSWDPKS